MPNYVTYTFDALNRLSGVLENGTTTLASYDYDAASRRTDLTYGDTSSASYGYAANNDLTSLTQSFTGSSVSFTYGYNNVGQRTSVNISNGSFLYHPPAASSVSYAPNSVNQYTTVGASSLIYDGNGNLTGDGTDSFSYDTENHLTSASALGNTIAYAYDPLGRRDSKTVNTTVTRFVWAGNQTIADYDGAGLDEPIVTITVNGASSTKAYNHQDGHGSVVALSDGATGAVTDIYAYGPYGESASLAGNAFRFTGRRLDAESGLYYYRARYYSPSLGRFLQTDPIGTTGGINLYAYVNDDPLNLTDPSGLLFKQMGRGAWHVISDPHAVLTGASFCPSVCGSAFSALDALVYYAQGDNTNGGIALAAAAIGVVGDAGAAKVAALGVKELAGAARGSGGEPIYRLGNSRESVTRLGRKSQQAEDALGIHGVSGSTTPPAAGTPCSAANCSALEAAGFRVHRTPSRRDPGHVTIELPKPVSKEAADAFNEVFGR